VSETGSGRGERRCTALYARAEVLLVERDRNWVHGRGPSRKEDGDVHASVGEVRMVERVSKETSGRREAIAADVM